MEYLIYGAEFDSATKKVALVHYIKREQDMPDQRVYAKRSKLIDMVRKNKSFFVGSVSPPGKWKKTGRVGIVEVDDTQYLRIDNKPVASDCLGNFAPDPSPA